MRESASWGRYQQQTLDTRIAQVGRNGRTCSRAKGSGRTGRKKGVRERGRTVSSIGEGGLTKESQGLFRADQDKGLYAIKIAGSVKGEERKEGLIMEKAVTPLNQVSGTSPKDMTRG